MILQSAAPSLVPAASLLHVVGSGRFSNRLYASNLRRSPSPVCAFWVFRHLEVQVVEATYHKALATHRAPLELS